MDFPRYLRTLSTNPKVRERFERLREQRRRRVVSEMMLASFLADGQWEKLLKTVASNGHSHAEVLLPLTAQDAKIIVDFMESKGLMAFTKKPNDDGYVPIIIDWKERESVDEHPSRQAKV